MALKPRQIFLFLKLFCVHKCQWQTLWIPDSMC